MPFTYPHGKYPFLAPIFLADTFQCPLEQMQTIGVVQLGIVAIFAKIVVVSWPIVDSRIFQPAGNVGSSLKMTGLGILPL